MSYMTLSSLDKHLLLLCSYFRAHPTTLFLKILGGRMHGPSPPQIFWGTVPPVSPRSPPMATARVGVHRLFHFRLPHLGGFPFTLLHLPLDFIRVSSLPPTYTCTHLIDPSLLLMLSFQALVRCTKCCGPKGGAWGVQCA